MKGQRSKPRRLAEGVDWLVAASQQEDQDLQMPGDGRYQPKELKPFLGYDQWARWLILVEWFWLKTLAKTGEMSKEYARLLTRNLLKTLLCQINTIQMDAEERSTKHDIIALRNLMVRYFPPSLPRWLHFGATSYDIVDTAYALQLQQTFARVFWPQLLRVDELWRELIEKNAAVIQAGRTHLQTALPVTVGFWLATLHHRFVACSRQAANLAKQVPGKFSGAVGTYAAQKALLKSADSERVIMDWLELPVAEVSTQIVPPEARARFYFELVLLSGALANLGEDVRILQSSQFGELISESSTSSTMSHKRGNPIAAENMAGMHETVRAEFGKVIGTLVSDLQRDLRNSSVLRSMPAIMVYVFQQLLTTERLLKTLGVDSSKCRENFEVSKFAVVAELLHLSLQRAGLSEAHEFVNQQVVPFATGKRVSLALAMDRFVKPTPEARECWRVVPEEIKLILSHPHEYLGYAVEIATAEAKNGLGAL